MALGVCWSCLDTRQCRRCVCGAPMGFSCSCPPQVQEEFRTSFYEICNYFGRQGCGFKPSQYVDKLYANTDTRCWLEKGCLCMWNIKAGCQNAVQVGRKPPGPVEQESDVGGWRNALASLTEPSPNFQSLLTFYPNNLWQYKYKLDKQTYWRNYHNFE